MPEVTRKEDETGVSFWAKGSKIVSIVHHPDLPSAVQIHVSTLLVPEYARYVAQALADGADEIERKA